MKSIGISGAVPVATLNLQRGVKPGWTIPDAWHHQMVYGVSGKGRLETNLGICQDMKQKLKEYNSQYIYKIKFS